MFSDQMTRDLCVICADGLPNSNERGAAHRLLAHEMAARLRASPFNYNVIGDHPAFADDAGPDRFKLPDGTTRETRRGGPQPAQFYFQYRSGMWSGTVPASPSGDYGSAFAALLDEATALVASVRATMGGGWMDATRYLVNTWAPPGGLFKPGALLELLDSPDITLGVGSWRIQSEVFVRSESPTPGVSVGFELQLNGVNVATYSQTRATDPDGDDIDVVPYFGTTLDVTLVAPKVLTIVNSSANNEYMIGLLRFWEP
jgi:hypothetical protein